MPLAPPLAAPALELSGVGLRIGTGRELLSGITLVVPRGAVVTLGGAAGAGKSLLVEIAALARRPSRGDVRVAECTADIGDGAARAMLRRRVGWISQDAASVDGLPPVDEAALPLRIAGVARTEARRQAHAMLKQLGAMEAGGHGARWRVAVARALVGSPSLVLVDELGSFGGAALPELLATIERFRLTGVGFLVTSRDEALLRRLPNACPLRIAEGRLRALDDAGAALLREGTP